MHYVGIFFVAIFFFAILWVIYTYNKFVKMQFEVDNGWSAIDVQLKRRHDLIPNLVETAKGYMKHEAGTLERITELRSSIMKAPQGADVMGMENELTRALGSLLAVSENYPELKANENFLKLQEELTSTENRIAFSRGYFNEAVKNFNTAIRLFPASIISGALNFHPRDMWNLEGNAAEREPVAVKF